MTDVIEITTYFMLFGAMVYDSVRVYVYVLQ